MNGAQTQSPNILTLTVKQTRGFHSPLMLDDPEVISGCRREAWLSDKPATVAPAPLGIGIAIGTGPAEDLTTGNQGTHEGSSHQSTCTNQLSNTINEQEKEQSEIADPCQDLFCVVLVYFCVVYFVVGVCVLVCYVINTS